MFKRYNWPGYGFVLALAAQIGGWTDQRIAWGLIALTALWLFITFLRKNLRYPISFSGSRLGSKARKKIQGFVNVNHDTYNKAIALCKYALDKLGDPFDTDTRNLIVRVSYQRRIDDAEHARGVLFDRLDRKARGVPEAFDNYYREYQAMRSWIWFAFDLGVLESDWVGYADWHIADQAFLTQLRTLIAAPELSPIKDRVNAAGWGEGITSKLPMPVVKR